MFHILLFAEHENWFGLDDVLGPLAISIKREKIEKDGSTVFPTSRNLYRLIVRSTEVNFFYNLKQNFRPY